MTDFDFHEFIEVIFPVILKQSTKGYYVKGGRAYDFYFKNKTGSIDWDLIGTPKFNSCVHATLRSYADKNGLSLTTRIVPKENSPFGYAMHQYGFQDYFYSDDKDPFFVDIIIHDNISPKDYTRYDSVNYINLVDFVSDLIITQRNRYNMVMGITPVDPYTKKPNTKMQLVEHNDFANKMREIIYKKFLKTRTRFDNVIDLSWSNLSLEYRRYLVSNCKKSQKEIDLFYLSETCNSYLECDTKRVEKNTKGCISQEDKDEFLSIERDIK